MNHEFEKNIKCPYCDWEDEDSWEFEEDEETHICGECGEEFNVEREVEITYNTSKIDCEEKELEHDYKFEAVHLKDGKFTDHIWKPLPESEWEYYKIMICSTCDDKEYVKVTKEEYDEFGEV